jgi:dihydroxy-acid dehydratase
VIADCIETCVNGQWMDGVIVIGGCDKNMPGGMMAIARCNVPAIYVYGGTVKPGRYKGKDLTIVSAFEAVGEFTAGRLNETDFKEIERRCIPGSGSCGGMYTANTMSSSFEALGMSLLYSSTQANPDQEKVDSTAEAARVLVEAIRNNLLPSDIITRKSIENAVSLIMAVGGSTNAVLHFLAIAHSAGIPGRSTTSSDPPQGAGAVRPQAFGPVRRHRPAPGRRHPAGAEDPAGQRPAARRLHDDHRQDDGRDAGRRPGRAARRPGRDPSVREPAVRAGPPGDPEGQPGAPKAAWPRSPGLKNPVITGPARVFESEDEAMEAILADRIKPGDVS